MLLENNHEINVVRAAFFTIGTIAISCMRHRKNTYIDRNFLEISSYMCITMLWLNFLAYRKIDIASVTLFCFVGNIAVDECSENFVRFRAKIYLALVAAMYLIIRYTIL